MNQRFRLRRRCGSAWAIIGRPNRIEIFHFHRGLLRLRRPRRDNAILQQQIARSDAQIVSVQGLHPLGSLFQSFGNPTARKPIPHLFAVQIRQGLLPCGEEVLRIDPRQLKPLKLLQ